MTNRRTILGAGLILIAGSGLAARTQHVDPAICTLHSTHTGSPAGAHDHAGHAAMEARGSRAMGFDQAKASHHFRLMGDGGRIEIHINQRGDDQTREQIAGHLRTIARRFGEGDFGIPVETHGAAPDGTEGLRRHRQQITYRVEPTDVGGRLVITSASPDARTAIHDFLRYQIREHKTGDPVEIER